MPGSRDSSCTSRSSGSGSCGKWRPGLDETGGQAQPAGDRLHLFRGQLLRCLHSLVDRGHDQVLKHLCVRSGGGVDRNRHDLLRARGHHPHRATARACLDGLALELGLDLGHAVLHLLDLAQHLHRVLHSETSLTRVTRPSNRRTTSRTNGSSSGLAGVLPAGLPGSAVTSRSLNSTVTVSPSHARTRGSSCADCSCAFLWWKPYWNHNTSVDPLTSGFASR